MRICVLGATGLVGRETIGLVERAWPDAEVLLFASRDQQLGDRQVLAAGRLDDPAAPGGELAFVALDDEYSRRYVPRLLELGYRVVDKSNTYRTDPAVVLGVAGVNHDLVTADVRLVANPNCTSIPLALALAPLRSRFGLAEVTVSTYQAISGAGLSALDEFLAASQRGYADPDRLGVGFDAGGYAANTVPHDGGTDESGYSSEERKLMFESRKILGTPDLPVSAQCCRVPVAVGHYETVWLTFDTSAPPSAVHETLRAAPFLTVFEGQRLSALSAVDDRDQALVGQIRFDGRDPSGRRHCLTVVGDNLRLGAATNAVRLASCWYRGKDADLNVP
jgi:aspartate-semialdehyde dehydrogenase